MIASIGARSENILSNDMSRDCSRTCVPTTISPVLSAPLPQSSTTLLSFALRSSVRNLECSRMVSHPARAFRASYASIASSTVLRIQQTRYPEEDRSSISSMTSSSSDTYLTETSRTLLSEHSHPISLTPSHPATVIIGYAAELPPAPGLYASTSISLILMGSVAESSITGTPNVPHILRNPMIILNVNAS